MQYILTQDELDKLKGSSQAQTTKIIDQYAADIGLAFLDFLKAYGPPMNGMMSPHVSLVEQPCVIRLREDLSAAKVKALKQIKS